MQIFAVLLLSVSLAACVRPSGKLFETPASSSAVVQDNPDCFLHGLRSSDQVQRHSAVEALIQIADREGLEAILPTVLSALKDSQADVRVTAATLLGALAFVNEGHAKALAKAVPALVEALRDQDARVRDAAARALGFVMPHPPEIAAAPLISTLNDPEPKVRKAALGALSRVAPVKPEMVSAVVAVLKKDESAQVKGTAAAVLGDFRASDPAAVEALREALHDPDVFVRQEAIRASGKIGPRASATLPELERIGQNSTEEPLIRELARDAIHSITEGKR